MSKLNPLRGQGSAEEETVLTCKGYKKLKRELNYLRSVRRPQITQKIKEAREHGDLRENAEYQAAKEEQSFVESRIMELEKKLENAKVMDRKSISGELVAIGTRVRLLNLKTGEEQEYTVVGSEEMDPDNNIISVCSPIAKGLLGHKKGDEVEIKVPAGILNYRILGISPDLGY